MKVKCALALVLILQVSVGLCEVPPPDQELIDKYNSLKAVFYRRILTAYGKLQAAAAPLLQKVGEHEHGGVAKQYIEELATKPELQAVAKVAAGLGEEAGPLVDKARSAALGVYGTYVRPHIGNYLSDAIDHVKVYLDKYLPAE